MPHHWDVTAGGAEYQVKNLTRELLRTGKYQITTVTRVAPPDPLSDELACLGVGNSLKRPRLGYLMDTVPLYRTLRRVSPDVIYQRVGCGYTAIAAYYARRHRVPMIWHASSDTDVSPALLIGSTNALTRTLEKCSLEFGLRNAHRIICQTFEQARLLESYYGRRADAVIPNFHPAPQESVDKSGPMTILWVANMKQLKQPEVFVRLAAQLRDLMHVRFVMIGSPPAPSRRDREWRDNLLLSLEASANVHYVGQQSQEQVNEWLARSHLLVSTSLQEGFPNTFIQAWMRQVPVISLHVNPDGVLSSQPIGVCVTSEVQLEEAVRSLVMDDRRRLQYGECGRRHAQEHHSLRNVQRVEQLIDACLEARRGGA